MANIVYKRSPPASRRGILNLAALQAAQAHHVIVFRPGGTAGGNVYVTWAAVVAELAELDGPKVVYFDDDLGTPTIPTGAWDVNGAVFAGDDQAPASRSLLIEEGAVIQNLARIEAGLSVSFSGTTAPIVLTGDKLRVDHGAILACSDAGPIIRCASGINYLYLGQRAILSTPTGAAPGLVQVETGASLLMLTQETVAIGDNVFSGGGDVGVTVAAAPDAISETHAGLTGAFVLEGTIPIAQASKMLEGAHTFASAADLASTANAKGASQVGIEDALNQITATTVEGAIAENRTAIDGAEAALAAVQLAIPNAATGGIYTTPAPISQTGVGTLTAAQVLDGVVYGAPSGAPPTALTLPTAADMVAGFAAEKGSAAAVGDSCQLSVININNTGSETWEVTMGAGGNALAGNMTVGLSGDAQAQSGIFLIRLTNVGGGTEAYDVIRIS